MRVIAGKFKSRVLSSFEGKDIRPTSDRVKESLFGILTPLLYGSRALDLFSGSGSLGIEALSRGAKEVVFNDSSRESVELLKKNLKTLGIEGQRVMNMDYVTALNSLGGRFDIIFLDPPYREKYEESALSIIDERSLLSSGGVIAYEKDKEVNFVPAGLEKYDVRRYGKAIITFFRNKQDEQD